jgi:hypothetical protein
LLIGSVVHGTALEAKIAELIPLSGDDGTVGLTGQISRSSPYPVRIGTQHHAWTWDIHSSTKLKLFYWLVAAILLLFAVIAVKADQTQPGAPNPAVTPTAPASQHP